MVQNQTSDLHFTFEKCFDENVSQEEMFSETKLDLVIDDALKGLNSTVLVYGQTGSGKTHT